MSVKITAADVKKLRDQTGAGMMDVKKALQEAEGNFDAAIDILRKKGQKLSAKRADREATEGAVIALTSSNRNNGVIIRLSCETDFVAKGDGFVEFAQSIAEIALKKLPENKEELLGLEYESGLTIAEKVVEQIGVIGEKLEVSDYEKIVTAAGEGQVIPYIHMGNRAAVIVALNLEGPDYIEPGKNVAMQVAAMRPVALGKEQVSQEVIDKELEIAKELAIQEGKPENMIEKIALGRLNKFFKENTLLQQSYVKNNKETIQQYLSGIHKDLTVTDFKHVFLS